MHDDMNDSSQIAVAFRSTAWSEKGETPPGSCPGGLRRILHFVPVSSPQPFLCHPRQRRPDHRHLQGVISTFTPSLGRSPLASPFSRLELRPPLSMSTPRERLRQPIDGPGRGHGAGWGRSQSRWEYRRRFAEIPTYADVTPPPRGPPSSQRRYTPAAAAGCDLGKVTKQVPIKNQMTTKNQEVNNNLRYDGSRYNQNAPPPEDENTDFQGCMADSRQFYSQIEYTFIYIHSTEKKIS